MAQKPVVLKTFTSSYELFKPLGEGGSGIVYEAFGEGGWPCAVKVLNPHKATTEKRKRFRNEVAFCQRDVHRNVLRVADFGVDDLRGDEVYFYAMDFYPKTLRGLMNEGITGTQVLTLFKQLLDGVEAAHLHGVYHRDLKPENVLCDPDRKELVVADFGIAHFAEEQLLTTVETGPHSRLANFAYAAPEQRKPGASVDGRADIFALGLLLHEMLTGSVPHGTGYDRIGAAMPELKYLDSVVERMIRSKPSERPATINEVRQQLSLHEAIFIEGQKLSRTRNTVVAASDVDDPLVLNPISLKDVDYDARDGVIHFTLSATPTPEWETAFKTSNYQHAIMGKAPDNFHFAGARASIRISPDQAKELKNDFVRFLGLGNEKYALLKKRQEAEKLENERQRLRREAEQAETRLRVLRELSS